ncbi:nuclear transport factor 2 family protein [Psychroserpens burtonensis]|uniref:Nuclear transport factor 2 family protein n=1 Tax=Psychroserpens burtonensis TaxID=49278 RepID=A0A5C7BEC3_9FLAO|nr:nuclear transport factor 2 family protein [Psychroserpens burtonensis]TXE20260.1 nuclear transport factor 2 family protein [Psychroserpens burtonensis]
MSAKQIVKAFYDLDLAKDEGVVNYFHKDCELKWHSSKGYTKLDLHGLQDMLEGVKASFHSFKYRLSHLLEDGNTVTARYTIYVTSIERPKKEDALAHFISIWEVKDGKLYKGYEMSQLADDTPESLNSYAEIKV